MSSGDPSGTDPTEGEPATEPPGAKPPATEPDDVDPRGHEGAPPVPMDAPVESAPADESLGTTPSAADRGPIPAAGAPAELTSDDDRPGQSPDGAAEVPKPRAPRDGLAPGQHEAGGLVPTAPAGAPPVTTTSSPAAGDVPVLAEAITAERTAPEGGDTEREGVEAAASTADDAPDATAPGQAEPEEPSAPAAVADVRPTEATNDDGTAVPDDSSALAVTRTDVADEIAARGDVAAPAATADAPVAQPADAPSVDVHAEPSRTDAPGDSAPPSGDAAATNPPVDAPTDLPAPGVGAATPDPEVEAPAAPVEASTEPVAAPEADAPAAAAAPEADAPGQAAEPEAAEPEPVAAPEADAPAAAAAPEADAPGPAAEPGADAPGPEDDAPAAAAEPEVVVVDEVRQPLLDLLAEHLGDGLVATHVVPGRDMTVRVTRQTWVRAGEVCRDVLGMRYFGFLSAMDWMPSPYGRSEDGGLAGAGIDEAYVAPDTGVFEPGTTGGETRFQVLARLEVPAAPSLGITIKCDVPPDDLVMPSWITVFPGADWHERECAEMFGIGFAGHPNLVKLYLPGAFEGFPLRKDFPLLARDVKPWPGLVDVEAMPGEDVSTDDDESVSAGAEEG